MQTPNFYWMRDFQRTCRWCAYRMGSPCSVCTWLYYTIMNRDSRMDLIGRSSTYAPKELQPWAYESCSECNGDKRGSATHVKSLLTPPWPVAFFPNIITGRADRDSGWSLCTRQSAISHCTTMELVCGQGRLRRDKYASMPQRRCSYFHRFVWVCKFMCLIPVYYINAPGQNENEYSQMSALAHTRLIRLKSINTDIVALPFLHLCSMLQMMQPLSRAWMIQATHLEYAADTKPLNLLSFNVFYTHWAKMSSFLGQ